MVYTLPKITREQEDDILKSMNYSRKQLESDTLLLRTWLNEQEHFPESRRIESDTFLVSHLVACKGSVEKAKKKLDGYYSIRGHGDLFTDRDTLDYVDSVDDYLCFLRMPKATPDGLLVLAAALWHDDASKYDFKATLKKSILNSEVQLRHGSGIIGGVVYLMDAKNFTAAHAMKVNPSQIRSTITWLQECEPIRLKLFLVFNANSLVESIGNTLVRPFLSEKLKKRFFITSDKDVSKYFPHVDILPSTYGGKEADRDTLSKEFTKSLKEAAKEILPRLGETTDESKRPKINGFTHNPNFGAFGSIKTLVVD